MISVSLQLSNKNKFLFIFISCFTFSTLIYSQSSEKLFTDSISISLDSAEHIFLKNNLLVLAQRYNVDAQKALIIQAKLLPNPNFSLF